MNLLEDAVGFVLAALAIFAVRVVAEKVDREIADFCGTDYGPFFERDDDSIKHKHYFD